MKRIYTNYKNNKRKKIIIITIISILLCFLLFYTYSFYRNLDLYSEYETNKLQPTISSQTVEKTISESTSIADMIEIVSSSVVGISKLTNTGDSIFSSNEVELGLGTGVIVSSNGYILSNAHVTGEKYNTCYITLENGKTFTGLVEWSDTSLDLSITKISATDLPYVTLGDSSNLRAGETVFAIGDPIRL